MILLIKLINHFKLRNLHKNQFLLDKMRFLNIICNIRILKKLMISINFSRKKNLAYLKFLILSKIN